MLFYLGMAVSTVAIAVSSINLYKKLDESLIIKKRDFEKIEKKIRLDERRKTIEQFNK